MNSVHRKPRTAYMTEYLRERYKWLKEHHICVECGKADAYKNHVYCLECLARKQERRAHTKEKQPITTEERYLKNIHKMRRYDLCVAFGVCPQCNKHNAMPGHVLCLECNLKKRKRDEERQRKKGIYPHDSYFDMCVQCGKNTPLDGKKLCSKCYEQALRNLNNADHTVDRKNHIWRYDNSNIFNRRETGVQQ